MTTAMYRNLSSEELLGNPEKYIGDLITDSEVGYAETTKILASWIELVAQDSFNDGYWQMEEGSEEID